MYIYKLVDTAKLSSRKAISIHFLINRAWEPVALYPCQYWPYSFLNITVKPVSKTIFIYFLLITREVKQAFLVHWIFALLLWIIYILCPFFYRNPIFLLSLQEILILIFYINLLTMYKLFPPSLLVFFYGVSRQPQILHFYAVKLFML